MDICFKLLNTPLRICLAAPTLSDLNRALDSLIRENHRLIQHSGGRLCSTAFTKRIRFHDGTVIIGITNAGAKCGGADGYRFDQVFEVRGADGLSNELVRALNISLMFTQVPKEFQWMKFEE